MLQDDTPTSEQIRSAIEARIDRTLALEELSWRLHSFVEDLWGPLPEAWATGMAELGVELSRGAVLAGKSGNDAWESGRSQILGQLTPHEVWLVGLTERLWLEAFDRARESIRTVAIDAFLETTLAYIAENPDVPPAKSFAMRDSSRARGEVVETGDAGITRLA
jgi:hypothetical protein